MGIDDDDDEDMEEINDEQGLAVNIDRQSTEVIPDYSDVVQKVVQIFRGSPTKDDMYLQKYVQEETGKELSLILECRTHWNSLLDMLDRFYSLKVCIEKVLIDIVSDKNLLTKNSTKSKTSCRKESTLITAYTTFQYILEKLEKQDTVSNELSEALCA